MALSEMTDDDAGPLSPEEFLTPLQKELLDNMKNDPQESCEEPEPLDTPLVKRKEAIIEYLKQHNPECSSPDLCLPPKIL